MTSKNWAIRTVKDGQVKVGGLIFRPQEYYQERDGWLLEKDLPYQGELEGLRLVFGRYLVADQHQPFIWLHSQEGWVPGQEPPGPHCINGTFRWDWWYTEQEWQRIREFWRDLKEKGLFDVVPAVGS